MGEASEMVCEMQYPPIDADAFKAAMRCVPGAAMIFATGQLQEPVGMTVTSVVSLSANPPSLVACINKSASAHDVVLEARAFTANILHEHQVDLAERFAGAGGLKGKARFAFGNWSSLRTGAPALLDAAASIDCVLSKVFDGGTHSIFVGSVVAAAVRSAAGSSLVYWRGGYAAVTSR